MDKAWTCNIDEKVFNSQPSIEVGNPMSHEGIGEEGEKNDEENPSAEFHSFNGSISSNSWG